MDWHDGEAARATAWFLAKHRERHVAPWEKQTSAFAKVAVAAFLGEVRLEWARGWKLWEDRK